MNKLLKSGYIGSCTACIRKSVSLSVLLVASLMLNQLLLGSSYVFWALFPISAISLMLSLSHLYVFSYRVTAKRFSAGETGAIANVEKRRFLGAMVRYGAITAASMAISTISPRLSYAFDNMCGVGTGNAINCGQNTCCYDSQENDYYCCELGTVCVGATSTSGRGCRGA
jgi:hypothetical protein